MSEYNLDFAEAMARSSGLVLENSSIPEEAQRASLYMALVSMEVSLKYLLSKASISAPKTHDLEKLLMLVSKCTVEDEIAMGTYKRVPASRIQTVTACEKYSNATLGHLLRTADLGVSRFPNEVRYGHTLKHFPASVMQKASMQLLSWVRRYEHTIKG